MGDNDSIDRKIFLTYEDVEKRWFINKKTLLGILRDYNVEIHVNNLDVRFGDWNTGEMKVFAYGSDTNPYLRLSVIKEFEQTNDYLFKKIKDQSSSPIVDGKRRNSQRHRERCRALAQYLWEQHPKQTIAGMARSCVLNRIGCERTDCGEKACKTKKQECNFYQHGNPYPEGTLLGWIRDLSPNPNKGGGRPRKVD